MQRALQNYYTYSTKVKPVVANIRFLTFFTKDRIQLTSHYLNKNKNFELNLRGDWQPMQ